MLRRTVPFTDFSTEDNQASKLLVEQNQKGTVFLKRVNADRTALGVPLLFAGLPCAKAGNDADLSVASTSGRRKNPRKRTCDSLAGSPFTLQPVVQKAERKGYTGKQGTLKEVVNRIIQEKKSSKDASDRNYKTAEDVSILLEKLNKEHAVKDFLGMCCTLHRDTPSRAVSCKATSCQALIDLDVKCWEHTTAEERVFICHKCYAAKKVGESISVKTQKYSVWNNEWIHTEIPKSEFRSAKLEKDSTDEEHTVVCSYCWNTHHVICAKYEPYNFETAYGKYCKDYGEIFRPTYVCKKCMHKLDPTEVLPKTPGVLFHPAGLAVTELARNMEAEMRQFYYEETEDAETVIYVREISSRKGIFEALPRMKIELEKNGKPSKWEYIRRNIMVFQQRPDAEYPIALFNMIVYEYPEISSVNLSYLDSVKLFEPSGVRKKVYQKCVLSYLREVRKKYQMLYFWVCPPSPGDEYVFYGRPTEVIDQTLAGLPENGLVRWYKEIMEMGKRENIVTEFLQAGSANPYEGTSYLDAPYMLDDFWPTKFEAMLAAHEKETADYEAAQNTRSNKRSRTAKSKKTPPAPVAPPSLEQRYDEAVKECNDSLFVVHLKNLDDSNPKDVKEAFEETDVFCSYMSNRDNFIVDCRENRFDFSTPRRAEYSTLVMCSKIAQESRTKKCIVCEKSVREGVYCYTCPAQENQVFCSSCASGHEHKKTLRKFRVPYFEEPGPASPIFGKILKHQMEEASFITKYSHEICVPSFKRLHTSEEFKTQAKVISLHVAALNSNSVDENVHQQTNCRACAAAWLPLIRHKEWCRGKVCSVPSCTSTMPFDNNGIIHRAAPTRNLFV